MPGTFQHCNRGIHICNAERTQKIPISVIRVVSLLLKLFIVLSNTGDNVVFHVVCA
jgi:hypothetical protein